jgi:hypothetical protein
MAEENQDVGVGRKNAYDEQGRRIETRSNRLPESHFRKGDQLTRGGLLPGSRR